MGFSPWIPNSPSFLSSYHIPVIPVSSWLTIAICSCFLPQKWPQSVQKSKMQRKLFLGGAVKDEPLHDATGPARWYSHRSTSLMCQGLWDGGVRQLCSCQQPGALLGKPHPPALGLHISLTSPKIHSPSSTSTPVTDNVCFGQEYPGLLTPISLFDHLLHFIYYSSWMFRFKILLCMWASYIWSIISPWIWGCWVGEGRKKKRSWIFQATPFDLQRKYITAVCQDTSVQGLCTAVMEPGHRIRAAPLQRQHMGHFCLFPPTYTTLSPPPQGCQPAGKELRWGGETKESQALPSPVTAVKRYLRDTNTCLPTHCALMLFRACRTITPIPSEAQWLTAALTSHPASIKTSSRVLGAGEGISNMPQNHPSSAKQQVQFCAIGPRETLWI